MSEHAFETNGEHFEIPETVSCRRAPRAEAGVGAERAPGGGLLDSDQDDVPSAVSDPARDRRGTAGATAELPTWPTSVALTARAIGLELMDGHQGGAATATPSASGPPTGSGRGPRLRGKELAPAPDRPERLWWTEFEKQYTKDMLRDLVRRATALTRRYERFTTQRSTDTAMDRIHAAVVKLYEGARIWDQARVDLCGFLLGVIASDLASEVRRSKMAPQISLDDRKRKREDDYSGEPCDESGAESRMSVEDGWPVPLTEEEASPDAAWCLAVNDLRKRAGPDALVLALLGAYEEHAYVKRDVMKLLTWSATTYERAYRRLSAVARVDRGPTMPAAA